MTISRALSFFVALALASTVGCAGVKPIAPAPAVAPAQPPPAPVAELSTPGSLWSESRYHTFLDYDRKAQVVGDLVTVIVEETAQATRSASTNLSRESEASAGVSAMFGLETKIPEIRPSITPSTLLGTQSGSSFAGDGETMRSGTLTATVTARVVAILANGNLVIEGRQQVKVNQEIQILLVRGIVRPEDIRIDNTIPSTHIADAQIEYTGAGVVAEKQVPGWGSRVIEKAWPF